MKKQMSMEEYKEHIKKMNILRWTVVTVYIVLTMGLALVPIFYPVDGVAFAIGYNIIVFGGMIIMFAVLLYPFLKKAEMPEAEDGKLLDGILDEKDLPEVYHEKVRTFLVYEMVIPFLLLQVGLSVFLLWIGEFIGGLINVAVTVLLVAVLIFFGHLEVSATKKHLHFHYGPIGKKVPYKDIKSIRSTAVHAFKDFMGWGIRMGPDGTWGYIASGKVGVRLKLKNGKKYVVTVKDPETLVAYVRAMRKEAKK